MQHHAGPEIFTTEITAAFEKLGLRWTPQRQLVLQILQNQGGHLKVEEIYQQITRSFPAVNRSTVYRTLETLVEAGIVVAIAEQGPERLYELVQGKPHYHAICENCSLQKELDDALISQLKHEAWEKYSLKLNLSHFIGYYICEECRHKKYSQVSIHEV